MVATRINITHLGACCERRNVLLRKRPYVLNLACRQQTIIVNCVRVVSRNGVRALPGERDGGDHQGIDRSSMDDSYGFMTP